MNATTLLNVLALVSANQNQHGDLTGVPVQFSPDLHPKATLTIDLNDKRESDDDDAIPTTPFNSNATFNSTDLVADNRVDPRENEITAVEILHEPNGVVFKPYYADAPISDGNPKHISPKEALESVLKRMEEQTFERLHNCYLRIGEFNDYNYQKYQEIQYLSYSDKKKQEIIIKSQELKDAIMSAYVRLRVFIKATEKYRSKLTTWRDDSSPADFGSSIYWPQPETVPEIWYLLYNTETIVMQLFTPKPPIQTFLDESTKVIRMLRVATVQMIPRSFLPVPQYNVHNNNALDRLFGTASAPEDAPNELRQATFSKDDYEQQVMVFYMFKYFEYKTGDLARHVTFISNKLKKLEANTNEPDLIQIGEQKEFLAAKLSELQHATIQMELYRTNSDLIEAYNAEARAIAHLPEKNHIIKCDDNKCVTIKNKEEALAALEKGAPNDLATAGGSDVDPTVELGKPLEWDKNWPWDF